jgi:hypothetical protein
MVRRRLSFWTFYFDNIAGSRRMRGDLDLGHVEYCAAGDEASSESAAARRRAATMSDGLICSRTQTARIALRFFDAFPIETELFVTSPNDIPRKRRLELRSDNSRRSASRSTGN